MPTKRCCCGTPEPCPIHCIPLGTSGCSAAGSGISYIVREPNDVVNIGDTGFDRCCSELYEGASDGIFQSSIGSCTWTLLGVEPPCVSLELTIISDTEATLTISFDGGKTLVYLPNAEYDPLCTSIFTYNADLSDPPAECSWPDRLCVWPEIGCCPDRTVMPLTLYATVSAAPCVCGTNPSPADELTWNPATSQWEGTIGYGDCGTSLIARMYCVKREPTEFIPYIHYQFEINLLEGSCNVESAGGGDIDPTFSCTPFVVNFYFEDPLDCCPGFEPGPWILTVTE